VSSPWTDDELLQELAAALQEPPMDESVIRAAQEAFTWRTVDDDLVMLELDSSSLAAAGASVRDQGPGAPQTLAFRGEQLSVEVEIDEAGIVGQLTPPRLYQVTLVTADGPGVTTQADDVGCFTFPRPASGPMRLDCRLGDARFVTQWVTV
jgi:hypothetical protein